MAGGGENLVAMSISMTGHRGTVLAIYNWMSVLRISIMFLKCTLKYKSGILMISSASFETVFPAARQWSISTPESRRRSSCYSPYQKNSIESYALHAYFSVNVFLCFLRLGCRSGNVTHQVGRSFMGICHAFKSLLSNHLNHQIQRISLMRSVVK